MSDDIWRWSASTMALAIRDGRIAALDAVDACLTRIEAVNPAINAVVRLAADSRERAREADERRTRRPGPSAPPLDGVPFTIKDSLDTAGLVTTAGTAGWRDRIPERDATVVARLRAAGGILIGKTNTPEFTWSDETDNDVFGRTANPYDLTRTPGGSSGGAAAIVAAGGAPFDIGSDTGNSIRQPAHVCGVAGLKPTSGRVPRTGHHPGFEGLFESFTQLGPIARRVEDLALLLPIIAGPDGEDPHVVATRLGDPAAVAIRGLRAVTFPDNGLRTPTAETIAAVRNAADALEDAGASVREAVPPAMMEAWSAWQGMIRADGFAWLRRLINDAGTPGWGSYASRRWIAPRPPLPGDELSALVERVDDVRARLLRWVRDVDLIICPAMPQPAIRHGDSTEAWFGDTYSDVHNLTGWPAVVVRGGTAPGGLPIGVQLVAPPWREDIAIAAAFVVESASGGWQPPAAFDPT